MIKKKYIELLNFATEARAYRKGDKIATTKFQYSLDKLIHRVVVACKETEEKFKEDVTDATREYASTAPHPETKEKHLIIQENTYVYTPENAKALEVKKRKLIKDLNETEIEIEPHLSKEIPALTEFQAAAFRGLVIPENYEIPEPDEIPQNGQIASELNIHQSTISKLIKNEKI